MENNKNKKSVKFQGDMLNFYDFTQVFVFTTNHHLKANQCGSECKLEFYVLLNSILVVSGRWADAGPAGRCC